MGESNNNKLIILILIIVLVIGIAFIGYNILSKGYETDLSQLQVEENIKKATGFSVTNAEGETVKLYDFRGKPVVVNFWATWCGPCKVELPSFQKLYEKYSEQVEFMMVNLTDGRKELKENVEGFVTSNKYTFPVFFDTSRSAYNTYNLHTIPKTLFIDKNGNLIKAHTGAMSTANIESYIKLIIGE